MAHRYGSSARAASHGVRPCLNSLGGTSCLISLVSASTIASFLDRLNHLVLQRLRRLLRTSQKSDVERGFMKSETEGVDTMREDGPDRLDLTRQ